MTPVLSITSHRTLKHMRAWCNDISFYSILRLDNPLSEAVDEAEALGTSWLNNDKYTIVCQSLPECLDD